MIGVFDFKATALPSARHLWSLPWHGGMVAWGQWHGVRV